MEDAELQAQIADRRSVSNRIARQIENELSPRLRKTDRELAELISSRGRLEQAKMLFAQLSAYQDRQMALSKLKRSRGKKKDDDDASPTSEVSTGEAHTFCKEVEALLEAFRYPAL